MLLSWYHLYRRRIPAKDEDDIEQLTSLGKRFVPVRSFQDSCKVHIMHIMHIMCFMQNMHIMHIIHNMHDMHNMHNMHNVLCISY